MIQPAEKRRNPLDQDTESKNAPSERSRPRRGLRSNSDLRRRNDGLSQRGAGEYPCSARGCDDRSADAAENPRVHRRTDKSLRRREASLVVNGPSLLRNASRSGEGRFRFFRLHAEFARVFGFEPADLCGDENGRLVKRSWSTGKIRGYLANVPQILARESLRRIYDEKCDPKGRIYDHIYVVEGPEVAEKVLRKMMLDETESRIDNGH